MAKPVVKLPIAEAMRIALATVYNIPLEAVSSLTADDVAKVNEVVNTISPRSRLSFILYYGLTGEGTGTYASVARETGCSRDTSRSRTLTGGRQTRHRERYDQLNYLIAEPYRRVEETSIDYNDDDDYSGEVDVF